jgi:hypothetical protein
MNKHDLRPLLSILARLKPGKLADEDVAAVLPKLTDVWDRIPGAIDARMAGRKLTANRAKSWAWEPPVLSFSIVRHGGTVRGSKRGERQRWSVDVEEVCTVWRPDGFEQITPNAPKADFKRAVQAIADAASAGCDGKMLDGITWRGPDEFAVNMAKFLPPADSKQTRAGRTRNLRRKLKPVLAGAGWEEQSGSRLVFKRKQSGSEL